MSFQVSFVFLSFQDKACRRQSGNLIWVGEKNGGKKQTFWALVAGKKTFA